MKNPHKNQKLEGGIFGTKAQLQNELENGSLASRLFG
jgi:hypothetical protein